MFELPFLATEKVSAETLFEGFNVDLQSTADLLKNLSNYNPTVWNYVSAITKQVTTPLGIAIMTVLLVMEFSNIARKIAETEGKASFEYFGSFIIKFVFVVIFIPNSLALIEAILSVGIHVIEGVSRIVAKGGMSYDTFTGFKGKGIGGVVIMAIVGIIVFLARLISAAIVNVLITLRFIQLYLMIPFTPMAIATLIHEEWRSVGIGFFKHVIAYTLQGILIFLTVSFVSLFENSINASGSNFFVAVTAAIVQAILLIIVLVGTQRTARNIMGM